MRVPIIMLSGVAGAGKDAVASILAKNYDAAVVAQADPMKRLAAELFQFSEEQLWGPSEQRNATVSKVDARWSQFGVVTWLGRVLPAGANNSALYHALREWFITMPQAVTARHALQTLGTEVGRAHSRNMWVDYALRTARRLLSDQDVEYSRAEGVVHRISPAHTAFVVIPDGRFKNELLAVRAAGGATVRIKSPGAGLTGDAATHVSETEQESIPDSWFDFVIENHKEHGLAALEYTVKTMMSLLVPQPVRLRTAP